MSSGQAGGGAASGAKGDDPAAPSIAPPRCINEREASAARSATAVLANRGRKLPEMRGSWIAGMAPNRVDRQLSIDVW